MSLIVDAIRRARAGRSNRTRSGSSTRSKLAWPRLDDVPLPDKKKAIEKRRKKELTERRKKWVMAIVGAVFTVSLLVVAGTILYGLLTMGQRLAVPFPAGTQSPPLVAVPVPQQPNQSSQPAPVSETQRRLEVLVKAGEEKPAVLVGPGIVWNIQSDQPFVAYEVAEGSNAKGQEHEMPSGSSAWGGNVFPGRLFVRGGKNDTRIQFFRQ